MVATRGKAGFSDSPTLDPLRIKHLAQLYLYFYRRVQLSSSLNILELYKWFCACRLMVVVSVPVLPWDPCPVCVSLLCFALYPKSTLKLGALPCPVLMNWTRVAGNLIQRKLFRRLQAYKNDELYNYVLIHNIYRLKYMFHFTSLPTTPPRTLPTIPPSTFPTIPPPTHPLPQFLLALFPLFRLPTFPSGAIL